MGFTDKEMEDFAKEDYVCDRSPLGMVYYKNDLIEVTGEVEVNYVEYPWISCFEVEGLRLKKRSRDKGD